MGIGNIDHLILIIYYVTNKNEFKKVFVKNFEITEKNANYVFTKLKTFFEKNLIDLSKLIGFCSDGANVMLSSDDSVYTKFKAICPNMFASHCICHRVALSSGTI